MSQVILKQLISEDYAEWISFFYLNDIEPKNNILLTRFLNIKKLSR